MRLRLVTEGSGGRKSWVAEDGQKGGGRASISIGIKREHSEDVQVGPLPGEQ